MSNITHADKVEMFKRAIRGENYDSIAKDYGYTSPTIGTFVKEIIASIDTPENKEKLIAEFPFNNKKFFNAYDYHGKYYSITYVGIVNLRLKAEFLIGLVEPEFVVPAETEEKLHLLDFLAFEIKNFLAISYHSIASNKSATPELVIHTLNNPAYIAERLKKMSLVGTGEDFGFKLSMVKIGEKRIAPCITHTTPYGELKDGNLYEEMICSMDDINCIHYIFA